MSDLCGDNRFEIIEAYKKKLIEDTNIESCPEEMAVIDGILFRFWQMGWIPKKEIIYCVGCKYMYTEETGFWCAQTGKEVRLDHYCGYAERREKTNEVNH